jgi:hypothetical protein
MAEERPSQTGNGRGSPPSLLIRDQFPQPSDNVRHVCRLQHPLDLGVQGRTDRVVVTRHQDHLDLAGQKRRDQPLMVRAKKAEVDDRGVELAFMGEVLEIACRESGANRLEAGVPEMRFEIDCDRDFVLGDEDTPPVGWISWSVRHVGSFGLSARGKEPEGAASLLSPPTCSDLPRRPDHLLT